MLAAILLTAVCAAVLTVVASVVISWSSNRSAVWNMAFAILLAFAALTGVALVAYLVTRAGFPR